MVVVSLPVTPAAAPVWSRDGGRSGRVVGDVFSAFNDAHLAHEIPYFYEWHKHIDDFSAAWQ